MPAHRRCAEARLGTCRGLRCVRFLLFVCTFASNGDKAFPARHGTSPPAQVTGLNQEGKKRKTWTLQQQLRQRSVWVTSSPHDDSSSKKKPTPDAPHQAAPSRGQHSSAEASPQQPCTKGNKPPLLSCTVSKARPLSPSATPAPSPRCAHRGRPGGRPHPRAHTHQRRRDHNSRHGTEDGGMQRWPPRWGARRGAQA